MIIGEAGAYLRSRETLSPAPCKSGLVQKTLVSVSNLLFRRCRSFERFRRSRVARQLGTVMSVGYLAERTRRGGATAISALSYSIRSEDRSWDKKGAVENAGISLKSFLGISREAESNHWKVLTRLGCFVALDPAGFPDFPIACNLKPRRPRCADLTKRFFS